MRMKFTFRSLLVAAGLLVGSNAWAETSVIYEKGTSGNEWNENDLNDWTFVGGDNTGQRIGDNYLEMYKTNQQNRDEYTSTYSFTPSKDIVTLKLDWNVYEANGSGTAGCYMQIGDVKLFWCGQNRDLTITIGSAEATSLISGGATTLRGTTFNVELTINQKTKDVNYSISNSSYNGGAAITGAGISEIGSVSSILFGWNRGGQQNNSSQRIMSIILAEEEDTRTVANYTVHFVDTEGNTVKDDVTRSGEVGSTVNANTDDMTAFHSSDEEYKYVYEGDNGGTTVTDDEKAELTITYKKYGKYTATVNAVYGGATLKSFTKDAYEDEKATFSISKYIQVEDKWYSTDVTDFMPVATAQNAELPIEYTPADISYFFEETDFTLSRSYVTTDERSIYSGGSGHGLNADAYAYKSVESGVYTLVIAGASRKDGSTASVGYGYRFNGENVKTGDTENITSTSSIETRTYTVAIPQGADFCLIENSGSNSFLYIDYVTLTRIPDVSVEISEAGYSTFSSEYTVTIPEGLTAYIATATDVDGEYKGTVTLQEVTGAVAVNTGLLLKGDAGETYQLPLVAEEGESYEGVNLLKPTAADGKVAAGNYIFAYNNTNASEYGFYYLNSEVEVGAGKAYLDPEATTAGINVLRFVFGDGTATAIEAPAAEAETEGAVYNVAGQQVGSDYKGIVIKNGKKYLNK